VRESNNTVERSRSFEVQVPQATLDELQVRLGHTRWISELANGGWEHGLSVPYMRQLIDYWRYEYDWRARELEMNCFAHFTTQLDGRQLHFIHERGRGAHPLPIILTHGFPDSFLRFVKVIPMLTDPASHGGDPDDSFDVVVPSLPGFGFSDASAKDGILFHIGDLWHELMTDVLGYECFAAHGGDWGSFITEVMARDHGRSIVGIHLTDVPFYHSFKKPNDPSKAEKEFLAGIARFPQTQGAYALVQGTQPQALALGLNDSPAGLAGWIIEKFRRWSDCDGEVEQAFTKDELLDNIMLYWVTGTINSSFAPYFDVTNASAMTWIEQKLKQWANRTDVPAAFAMFPKDLSSPPREWAERFFDVRRWSEMPRGGHFAALEQPELLVRDIREFFRPFRSDPVAMA
jgi:microsomal epoxide hydrolase